MKKKVLIISLCFVFAMSALIVGTIFLLNLLKPTAVEFINNSDTTLYYKLGEVKDITYTDLFVERTHENGCEYSTENRDLIYDFWRLRGDDYSAVCAYIYVDKNELNNPGKLFGIKIGESVRVEKNDTLGTEKRSLFDYLEENGFIENPSIDVRESYIDYIDGNRCHWYCYIKDNVELNVLVDQTGGAELRAFEIKLISVE